MHELQKRLEDLVTLCRSRSGREGVGRRKDADEFKVERWRHHVLRAVAYLKYMEALQTLGKTRDGGHYTQLVSYAQIGADNTARRYASSALQPRTSAVVEKKIGR